MITFSDALLEWHSPMFDDLLLGEINKLTADELLLQQALRNGSYATTDDMKIIILSVKDDDETIYAKISVFYKSMIPGCQCDDDPSPMNYENEYCELLLSINKRTAETNIKIL